MPPHPFCDIPQQSPESGKASDVLVVRGPQRIDYTVAWRMMRDFTATRSADTPDELWLVEHEPVFTLGLNTLHEHLLDVGDIPVIQVDRGGQVTYHGPGQLVAYVLLDIDRRKLGVRSLVRLIEQSVIDLLAEYNVVAGRRHKAPGVYVGDHKIAALGLRIRHGRSYHGLSLNVDMDTGPFERINPCGYPGQKVTQLRELGITTPIAGIGRALGSHMARNLDYTTVLTANHNSPTASRA
jgi:lipoyl(octanoyl) transferase